MGVFRDLLPCEDAEQLIDFTCASPWERLALDVELQLRAWHLHDGNRPALQFFSSSSASSSKPTSAFSANQNDVILKPAPIASARLTFAQTTFVLQLRLCSTNNSLDAAPLQRILGVSDCVMLASETSKALVAVDASRAAFLLSAMSAAASACVCHLPMIVPVGRLSSMRFLGRQLFPLHRRFSCDYTHRTLDHFTHLHGLLQLFQNKRTSAAPLNPPSLTQATISAKFMYDWNDFSFTLSPMPACFATDRSLSAVQLRPLADADPVTRIHLTALWDHFPASHLQHTNALAGMAATTATRLRLSLPYQLIRTIKTASVPLAHIPMTVPARALLRLAKNASKRPDCNIPAAPRILIDVHKILSRSGQSNLGTLQTSNYDSHMPANTHWQERLGSSSPTPTPLDEYLARVGEYVAAAATQDEDIDEEFFTSAVASLFEMDVGKGIMVDVIEALGPNVGDATVLERISRLLAACETVNAAQKLWNLFLDGVELHWEKQWIICGVSFDVESGPDHNETLVAQKLQMMNCCVERRRRDVGLGSYSSEMGRDERESMGRKKVLEGVELVDIEEREGDKNESIADRRVWEPYVQAHPFVTRDMVEEEQMRMIRRAENRIGNEGVEAKRQSLTLSSDMMAFKAANPKAKLGDFVRWFSPSDWLRDEGKESKEGDEGNEKRNGRLSARMRHKGNVWERLWNEADAVAARKQEGLFDSGAHGSKALCDLRAMEMTQVLAHLSVIQAWSCVKVLHHAFEGSKDLESVQRKVDQGRQAIKQICWRLGLRGVDKAELEKIGEGLDLVGVAEHTGLIASSIVMKLPPTEGMGKVVDRMACGEVGEVEDEKERRLVMRMAGMEEGGWRTVMAPEWREILMEGQNEERMYVRLSGDEFRVGFKVALDYSV